MDVLVGVLVTVIGAGVIAAIRALWVRRQRFIQLFRLHPIRNLIQRRNLRREAREVERRKKDAHDKGRIVPVSRSGSRPVVVKWSDDSRSYYFCNDLIAYKQALQSNRYPYDRTFHGNPPSLVSGRARLKATG